MSSHQHQTILEWFISHSPVIASIVAIIAFIGRAFQEVAKAVKSVKNFFGRFAKPEQGEFESRRRKSIKWDKDKK